MKPNQATSHCATIKSMTPTNGNPLKILTSTNTAIPPTEFTQITQTKSSPETIASLLNEAERMNLSMRKTLHGNVKYVYPFWKACQHCSTIFPCENRYQAARNRFCSANCGASGPRPGAVKPIEQRAMVEIACAVCGTKVCKPNAWLKRVETPTCSRECNGKLRGEEWKAHAHKGRAAWSEETAARYAVSRRGESKEAWKGGVTLKRAHGNYKGVRYVRCLQEFLSMARKDGYVMEHRLVVARAIGRPLLRTEVVHHVNHKPGDNRLENLYLFASNRDHKLFEAHGTPLPTWPKLSQYIMEA